MVNRLPHFVCELWMNYCVAIVERDNWAAKSFFVIDSEFVLSCEK